MEIIRRWNEKVGKDDVVYHLGDFCFARGEKDYHYYADQLNGQLIICNGNHDNRSTTHSIIQTLMIHIGGYEIYCSHKPGTLRQINLCGHVHDNWKVTKIAHCYVINVGVDVWEFAPIDIDDILQAIRDYDTKDKL